MAKRRAKKTVKPTEPKKPQIQTQQPQFTDLEIEVERQSGAIRVVRDVEIERLLTELRLVRSRFNEEQLQKPVLQVFEETLPNLSVVSGEGSKRFDVRWKERGSRMSVSYGGGGGGDGRDVHASFLQRLSVASIPRFGAFEYSSNVLEAPSEAQTLAMQEALQTPGVSSQRLSVGMTPKTLRLPKPGEMLLSVRGSPLGAYKENNMEAIHESEEG